MCMMHNLFRKFLHLSRRPNRRLILTTKEGIHVCEPFAENGYVVFGNSNPDSQSNSEQRFVRGREHDLSARIANYVAVAEVTSGRAGDDFEAKCEFTDLLQECERRGRLLVMRGQQSFQFLLQTCPARRRQS